MLACYSIATTLPGHNRRSQDLEPSSRREFIVGLSCTFASRTRPVPIDHLPGAPARHPHQVALCTASTKILVREGVPEHVRVHALDTGFLTASYDHLIHAVRLHAAALPDPQRLALCVWVLATGRGVSR